MLQLQKLNISLVHLNVFWRIEMTVYIVVSYAGHYHQAFRNKPDAMDYIKNQEIDAHILVDILQ